MKISDHPPPMLPPPSPGSLTIGAFRDMKFGIQVEISDRILSVCKTNVDSHVDSSMISYPDVDMVHSLQYHEACTF